MIKKAPDRLLIYSIVLAALIVAGAIVFVNVRNSAGGGAGGVPALTPYSEQVIIQSSLQACQKGDTCIVVDTTCSFCCKYVPINAKFESVFNDLFDSNCKNYSGAMCQCFDLGSYPSCVNGQCQLVKWDEEKKP